MNTAHPITKTIPGTMTREEHREMAYDALTEAAGHLADLAMSRELHGSNLRAALLNISDAIKAAQDILAWHV